MAAQSQVEQGRAQAEITNTNPTGQGSENISSPALVENEIQEKESNGKDILPSDSSQRADNWLEIGRVDAPQGVDEINEQKTQIQPTILDADNDRPNGRVAVGNEEIATPNYAAIRDRQFAPALDSKTFFASTSTEGNASPSTDANDSTSKTEDVLEISTLWAVAENPVWRPKKFIRNPKYPAVSATGFYFQDHSGGFVLIHRATNEYKGHYTKEAIKDLEEQYGKTNSKQSRPAVRRRRSAS